MTTDFYMVSLILVCGLVTWLTRIIPFVLISHISLPEIVVKWLSFIPITLFTALIMDGVIQQRDYGFGFTLDVQYLIALVPTILLAIFTKSMTITVLGGLGIVAILRFFM
ncbi:AzlD domain-containing protein [Staphylococcus auricularis]|uniref:AzlD domain-containing protein n=1 Tax=Staphylococcus auricularis TaxID=29379 RepID=A0AAW7MCR8_9STAP|nr:AzlD domain-containing protein [Staphylococcus auricularis]MDC6327155.1 AzlD domain-containing protein [Staphylococcus auricularis]MDN4533135.1 AzlD domain-containing protein [Staphylococcus auricularis]MDN4533363.1 AzlD domain-containing protein [Staphylococcus auricularis]